MPSMWESTCVLLSFLQYTAASFILLEWDEYREQYFLANPDFGGARASLQGFETQKRVSNSAVSSDAVFLSPRSNSAFGDQVEIFTDDSDLRSDLSAVNRDCDGCQLQFVANGLCDVYGHGNPQTRCNCEAFDWDGGDCCESTCVSTPQHQCGDGGYFCRDPKHIKDALAPAAGVSSTTVRYFPRSSSLSKRLGHKLPVSGAIASLVGAKPCEGSEDPIIDGCSDAIGNVAMVPEKVSHSAYDEVVPDVVGNSEQKRHLYWVDSTVLTLFSDNVMQAPREQDSERGEKRLYFWTVDVGAEDSRSCQEHSTDVFVGVSTPHTVSELSSYREWLFPATAQDRNWSATGHFAAASAVPKLTKLETESSRTIHPPGSRKAAKAEMLQSTENVIAGNVHHPVFATSNLQIGGSVEDDWGASDRFSWNLNGPGRSEMGRSATCPRSQRFGILAKLESHAMTIYCTNFASSETLKLSVAYAPEHGYDGGDSDADNLFARASAKRSRSVSYFPSRRMVGQDPAIVADRLAWVSKGDFDPTLGTAGRALNTAVDNEGTFTSSSTPRLLAMGGIVFDFEPASFGAAVPTDPLTARIVSAEPFHSCEPINAGSTDDEPQVLRYNNSIVVMERGRCDFINKVRAYVFVFLFVWVAF